MTGTELIDSEGREKYLSQEEITRVFQEACSLRPKQRAFLHTLFYTGARLMEAMALRRCDIDIEKRRVAIKTLKLHKSKNGKVIKPPPKPKWRRVPVPPEYLQTMDMVFDLRRGEREALIWTVTGRQAHNWIKGVMEAAGLPHHSPHTFRHTFGIMAAMRKVPQPTIQKWLGHVKADTTSIYTTAGGAEEDELARRMWE
jgi:integrase